MMKLPNNTSTTINKINKDNIEVVKVQLDKPQVYNYNFYEFEDDKSLMRYIKKLEKTVRSSFEYKNYINYLKDEHDLTSCKFFTNIDIEDIKKVGIEFHHYPFNLYEITETVLKKQTNFFETPVNTFDVCNEVMKLHYENMVGLVPLSKTIHELAHNGEIFINFNLVFGNVQKFMDDYHDYISTELFETIKVLDNLSERNALQSNNFILKKKFQSIIMEDREEPKIFISSDSEKKLA